MRRPTSHLTLNILMVVTLSLLVWVVSLPGCEPTQVKEKNADVEIKQKDDHIKIDIDRNEKGGLKIDIEKKDNEPQDKT